MDEATTLALLKFRENAVFSATCPDGRRFALRLHRPGYHSDAALESELQWIEALREQDFPVPPVIRNAKGGLLTSVPSRSGKCVYQCDLLGWVAGQTIGQSETRQSLAPDEAAETYRLLGTLAARLHVLSAAWNRPSSFTRHSWDEQGCVGPDALWGDFSELNSLSAANVALLRRAAALAFSRLRAYGKGPDRFGLIHADLIPDNVLRDGDRLTLIDFDDAGFGWYLWEFATAVFFLKETPMYELALNSMIDGYRETRALSAADLAVLPDLFVIRGLVYLGWFHTRRETDTARQMAAPISRLTVDLATQLLADAGEFPL